MAQPSQSEIGYAIITQRHNGTVIPGKEHIKP